MEGKTDAGQRLTFPDECPHCGAGFDWSRREIFFYEFPLRFSCGGCGGRVEVSPAAIEQEASDERR